ncbi:hypothetical protein ACNHKD_17065 [Methylocystis sp. JAN1]|uniref:hypothetical protein n=1 Tax=Methylocystis sp. JAN1 TaxID=3397211 RepID=UPI003FA340F6
MSPRDTRPARRVAVALAVLTIIPAEAFAKNIPPPPPPYRVGRPAPSYAGDCGPNPPPGYRYDLKKWRSGFSRDFDCYVLDEY